MFHGVSIDEDDLRYITLIYNQCGIDYPSNITGDANIDHPASL